MNETQKLKSIRERDSGLQVGRLGTQVLITDTGHVDTMLSEASLKAMSPHLQYMPETDWSQLSESISDPDIMAIIERRKREISLIRLAIGQVVGEYDNSNAIRELELALYDYYNPDLYYLAVRRKIDEIEELNIPRKVIGAEESRAHILDVLHELLPHDTPLEQFDARPEPETLSVIQDWLIDQFGDILDYIEGLHKEELDAEDIKSVFDLAIQSTPLLMQSGWRVIIEDREKIAISVYASRKEIVITSTRVEKADKIKKIVIHEVFGHALRSAIAEMSGDEIGQHGTASYARFEEAFMMVLEQCLVGKFDPSRGVDHYLAIGMSLTSHLDRHTIAQIFLIANQLTEIAQNQKEITDSGVASAIKRTRNQVARTFAGQTDVDEFIPHMKDIDYLHGISSAWELLNEIVRLNIVSEGMEWLLAAKFNPFNANDRALVERHHPMPSELKPYFKTRTNKN